MIDLIDPVLMAQNDTAGMAVLNELVLAMTADGGEKTLDAALREVAAGRGGEAALGQALKEALAGSASHGAIAVLDLLIDKLDPAQAALAAPGCGCRGRGGGSDGDLNGGIVLSSFTDSSSGGDDGEPNDDVDGDGKPDDDIVVTGTKPKTVDEDPGYEGDPGSDVGGGSEGGVGGGDMPGEGEEDEPDCRDTKATEADDAIEQRDDEHRRELGILLYKDASGQIQKSSIIEGDGERIAWEDIIEVMVADGISFSQVVGFVHNHDSRHYRVGQDLTERTNNALVNRYPSDNDWIVADAMVARGAGGPGGAGFALYVMDTTNVMREFDYSDKNDYMSLTYGEKRVGTDLPDETQAGSCGSA